LLGWGNRCKHEERDDESEHAKVYYVSGSPADAEYFHLTYNSPGFP